jgi:hypothetical protein
MISTGSVKRQPFRRIAAGLAAAVATLGIIAFTQVSGTSSTQADSPHDCRPGTPPAKCVQY